MTKQVKSKQRVADHGEVFTAEREVKAMCDLVADECLRIDSRFLDPACKSGVFLREIAKRLIDGLALQFPDLQDRLDHIFHKQLFGIAITDLTAMLSRCSVYCSKYPASEFSVSKFDDIHADGNKGTLFLHKTSIADKDNILEKYKVIITYAMSGGNKPSSDGTYQILSSLKTLGPNEACTETYLIPGVFDTANEASNLVSYMAGKFSRFLLLQALTSIHITKDKFCFVPEQNYTNPISDTELYEKCGLTSEERNYIEALIKPMDGGDE